jgi:hypothetical protein
MIDKIGTYLVIIVLVIMFIYLLITGAGFFVITVVGCLAFVSIREVINNRS